ncbi:B12-binding domain-containing radical SAM protein [Bosea thiooxidans]|nr:radical SAM protein [Bosea sp. (in: a-proteobacteria)]
MSTDRCRVLMIYPRFNPNSFWNYKATCELAGARHPAAPLGLITVAALLPSTWEIRLTDLNAEELDEADFAWADLVMTGGMLPQQDGTLAVIAQCRASGKPVVVGGPDATSTPEIYEAADFRVLGEAEEIMGDFVAAWNTGARNGVFRSEMGKTDVTKSPTPRFDLLKFAHYLHIGVQFSRGCPFNCEFCDIIELYGRVPRTKTNAQIVRELETLHALGYRGHVDFVDDNLIGNKKALKQFLPVLTQWIRDKNFPFEFSTEASINLADDPALMQAMSEANFFTIFVGIESPDTDTLISTQKKQNTRRSLAESVHRIYRAGLFVNAGFILGFDSEKGSVSRAA